MASQAGLAHDTRAGAVVFHWARRDRVFDRDILRLGTATGFSFSEDKSQI